MMTVNNKAIANAVASVGAILYLVCIVLVWLAPGLLFEFFRLTTHGLDVSSLRPNGVGVNLIEAVLGLALWTGASWVTGWLFAYFYNRFVKH